MKRGGPIQRRTPLKAGKPLKQGNGFRKSPGRARRTPIPPKRDRPRRTKNDGHSIPWVDVRMMIYVRAGGRCEGANCGAQLNIENMEAHHRQRRGTGLDCPCNALALCFQCHHARIHEDVAKARDLGQIVGTWVAKPGDEVVFVYGRGWTLLSCEGLYVVPPPAA